MRHHYSVEICSSIATLIKIGCYCISLASGFLGNGVPRKVTAIGELTKDGVDHQASINIAYVTLHSNT
jgi:hypothetical protein